MTITVSQGPEMIAVPDVFGKQYKDAEATLVALGFTVKRENIFGGIFGTVRRPERRPRVEGEEGVPRSR